MVEHKRSKQATGDPLDRVFLALADPTRRRLVHQLAERERTISELAEPFEMTFAGISKHLKVLESAGLVRRRIDGRTHYCSLRPEALAGALDWIAVYRNFWNQRLDALEHDLSRPSSDDADSAN